MNQRLNELMSQARTHARTHARKGAVGLWIGQLVVQSMRGEMIQEGGSASVMLARVSVKLVTPLNSGRKTKT